MHILLLFIHLPGYGIAACARGDLNESQLSINARAEYDEYSEDVPTYISIIAYLI